MNILNKPIHFKIIGSDVRALEDNLIVIWAGSVRKGCNCLQFFFFFLFPFLPLMLVNMNSEVVPKSL